MTTSAPRNLFAASSSDHGGPRALVQFRCGLLERKNKQLVASKEKGVFRCDFSEGLCNATWKSRETGDVKIDLLLFPDDCKFKQIKAPEGARCYVLAFTSSAIRHFFWMQEPNADKDEERCKLVNEAISSPQKLYSKLEAERSSASGGSGGRGSSDQIRRMLLGAAGRGAGSSTAAAPPTRSSANPSSGSANLNLSDLSQMIQAATSRNDAQDIASFLQQQQQQQQQQQPASTATTGTGAGTGTTTATTTTAATSTAPSSNATSTLTNDDQFADEDLYGDDDAEASDSKPLLQKKKKEEKKKDDHEDMDTS